MKLSNNESKIESLKEMIAYIKSKKKAEKFDKTLIDNWERSIEILIKNAS